MTTSATAMLQIGMLALADRTGASENDIFIAFEEIKKSFWMSEEEQKDLMTVRTLTLWVYESTKKKGGE